MILILMNNDSEQYFEFQNDHDYFHTYFKVSAFVE